MNAESVEIIRLGHDGDGVTAEGLFVPYTVPGDLVRVTRAGNKGRLEEILTPGPSRVEPSCRHFGRCGGCALQHLSRDSYLVWKREQVVTALEQRGLKGVRVDEIRAVNPATRRRAVFKVRGASHGVEIGFYEADSHNLIDVVECPVLVPELENLLAKLRSEFATFLKPGETAELHATAADTGVDLSLSWKRKQSPDLLAALAGMAQRLKLARLNWNGDLVALNAAPMLGIGRFSVALPPQAFLQPTREGEGILQELVREGIGDAKRVADLFAGCGTFALFLAEGRKVHAVEESDAMLEALGRAARARGTDVGIEKRDLFRRPLMPPELARFDAVVIDPPRPGAKAQVQQLAQSRVPRVVYVSCNVASFARDAKYLTDGGFSLRSVAPVDQFVWSPHVELVGLFERDAA